jgi:hypothetical protein
MIVAHPGHELLAHHWLETALPSVFILTDGAGRAGESRLHFSRACVGATGAKLAPTSGALTDREWYAALLKGDHSPFSRVARLMLDAARRTRAKLIVSDAWDGYNPMHDAACSIAAAVCKVLRGDGQAVAHLSVPAVGAPPQNPAVTLDLDAAAIARKEEAFSAYHPLRNEIALARATSHFRMAEERFYGTPSGPAFGAPPSYERTSQKRVRMRAYAEPLTFRRHFAPTMQRMAEDLVALEAPVGAGAL